MSIEIPHNLVDRLNDLQVANTSDTRKVLGILLSNSSNILGVKDLPDGHKLIWVVEPPNNYQPHGTNSPDS